MDMISRRTRLAFLNVQKSGRSDPTGIVELMGREHWVGTILKKRYHIEVSKTTVAFVDMQCLDLLVEADGYSLFFWVGGQWPSVVLAAAAGQVRSAVHTCTPSLSGLLRSRPLQSAELSSLCRTAASHWLAVSLVVGYICHT